ncbi:hypothetical protein ACWD1Y_25725, partial [Streptomyces sp. NPDC002814]
MQTVLPAIGPRLRHPLLERLIAHGPMRISGTVARPVPKRSAVSLRTVFQTTGPWADERAA